VVASHDLERMAKALEARDHKTRVKR
jgi:hypothetical protein